MRGGAVLGSASDTFGDQATAVDAPFEGIVIGLAIAPLVESGCAFVHVARLVATSTASANPTRPKALGSDSPTPVDTCR